MKENINDWQEIVLKLKKVINDRGLSYYRLAKMTGLKASNICRLLNLKQAPNLKTICLICNGLDISMKEIC